MTYPSKNGPFWVLFTGLTVLCLLLIAGLAMLSLVFWPVLAKQFNQSDLYYSQLPLSVNGVSETAENVVVPVRQPYPRLRANMDDVADGDWIRIPSIGVVVPLVLSPTMEDSDVLATLDKGAALYPNGVQPGHLGNTFISAHSTGEPWKGKYRFAFLRIDELKPGSLIHLDYQNTRYTYRVNEKDIIKPTPDFRVESGRPIPTVTFMACWPLWTTDQRMLVKGELTNITQLDNNAS